MIGLDTNVLVRYMAQDDSRQAPAAARCIEKECTSESPGYIGHVVLCELVWVLDGTYGYSHEQIAGVLRQLLRVAQLRVDRPQDVWRALARYEAEGADFADHLIGVTNLAEGCRETVTFERAAARADGFRLLA